MMGKPAILSTPQLSEHCCDLTQPWYSETHLFWLISHSPAVIRRNVSSARSDAHRTCQFYWCKLFTAAQLAQHLEACRELPVIPAARTSPGASAGRALHITRSHAAVRGTAIKKERLLTVKRIINSDTSAPNRAGGGTERSPSRLSSGSETQRSQARRG